MEAVRAKRSGRGLQWLNDEQAASAVGGDPTCAAVVDELADVLIYALSLANAREIDLSAAVLSKLERNERRFPVEKWRGQARGMDDAAQRLE